MPTAKVIDLSHHNSPIGKQFDFAKARADGCVGVICKASEGGTFRDGTYQSLRTSATAAGLLWGAYHFGTAAKPIDQVSNFLNAADPDDSTLMCLDFEENERSAGNSITEGIAVEMLAMLKQRLGRTPTLYTGPYMYKLFGSKASVALSKYRVWWARYSKEPELHPTWSNYWLWQFTDGHNGPLPHSVDGIGNCDCSTYDGTSKQLQAAWIA
jgi:lysozyme